MKGFADWMKPTVGAVCFGMLLHVSLLIPPATFPPWMIGLLFIALALATWLSLRRKVLPYSANAFAAGIFCMSSLVWGSTLILFPHSPL